MRCWLESAAHRMTARGFTSLRRASDDDCRLQIAEMLSETIYVDSLKLRFRSASVTDGIDRGYLSYMQSAVTGTSRNTLKQHFRQLLEKGHVVPHGSGRGAWYALA